MTVTNGQQGTQQPTLPADLQRRVDEATAATAQANARAAQAAARSAEIKAASDASAARLTDLKSLVPDLSTAKTSTQDVKDATPIWSSLLTYAALERIGRKIADRIAPVIPESQEASILVTGDADLSTSDATYEDVKTGLTDLEQAARELLAELEPPKPKEREPIKEDIAPIIAAQVAAAVLPGLLSVFSTDRTVSTLATAASDLAAAAPVAGALTSKTGITVVHDGFRLLPDGGLFDQLATIEDERTRLSQWKLKLATDKNSVDEQLAELKGAEDQDKSEIARLGEQSANDAARLDDIQNVLTAIEAFVANLRAIPAGATRSPLSTAALHEELHGESARFGYVLLVKAQAGQSQQQLTHHRIIFQDKFSTTSDISVTYVLIETHESSILAAGTVTGVIRAHGKIGEEPTVEAPTLVA